MDTIEIANYSVQAVEPVKAWIPLVLGIVGAGAGIGAWFWGGNGEDQNMPNYTPVIVIAALLIIRILIVRIRILSK